jgi:uncharacterized protein (UPF0248 family)
MVFPREVLNKLRWKEGENLAEAVIWYVHRGAPRDVLRISGDRVKALDRGFFDTDEATIPYHRILRIDYQGRTLFIRNEKAKDLS